MMCEYCEKGKPIKSSSWNGQDILNIIGNEIYHYGDEVY